MVKQKNFIRLLVVLLVILALVLRFVYHLPFAYAKVPLYFGVALSFSYTAWEETKKVQWNRFHFFLNIAIAFAAIIIIFI